MLVDSIFIYSWCNTCTMNWIQHAMKALKIIEWDKQKFCGNRNQSSNYSSYEIYWIYDWATNHNIMYIKCLYHKHQVSHFYSLCNFTVQWKYFPIVCLLPKSFNWFFLHSFSCFFHLTMNIAAITTIVFASPWTILYNAYSCSCVLVLYCFWIAQAFDDCSECDKLYKLNRFHKIIHVLKECSVFIRATNWQFWKVIIPIGENSLGILTQ